MSNYSQSRTGPRCGGGKGRALPRAWAPGVALWGRPVGPTDSGAGYKATAPCNIGPWGWGLCGAFEKADQTSLVCPTKWHGGTV